LLATITVIGMIVGLTEVANNVNSELQDVGNAFNHVNQGVEIQQSQLDFCG
jgi:hypothetical protein